MRAGPVLWYQPNNPNAPVAFRNSAGQIQYVFQSRSQPASAPAPAFQTMLSIPSQSPPPETPTPPSTSTPPATQGQRPTSSFSPQNADRRRLAHDIMRALLPLKGAPTIPLPRLSTLMSTSASAPETTARSTENGKRKPSPESIPPTPSKRQRIGDSEDDAQPDASISVEAKAEESGAAVVPLPPEPTSDVDIIDLTREGEEEESSEDDARMTDGPVDVQQTDAPETIPVRPPSVTSSDAADAHQVQEAITGDVPESSSPGRPSPPARTTKSPSLGAALEEVNRLHPSQDTDNAEGVDVFDLPEESMVLLSPKRPTPPPTSDAGASSPAVPTPRPKEKLPLFLPSSRSSSPDPVFGRDAVWPPRTEDENVSDASSAMGRMSVSTKGKGKARQTDTDVEMASSDESPRRSRNARRSMAYVLVPPLPAYARGRSRRSSSRATAAAREPSVDELATCPGASITTIRRRRDIDRRHDAVDEDRDVDMGEEGEGVSRPRAPASIAPDVC